MLSAVPYCASEIKNTRISNDARPMILFERFGFSRHGHVDIRVEHNSWNTLYQNPGVLNPSSMGFFVAKHALFPQIMNESERVDKYCVLTSKYVIPILVFKSLAPNQSYNASYTVNEADEYSLVFGNCQSEYAVTMDVHVEMYNIRNGEKDYLPAGQTPLPRIFFLFFLVYSVFFIIWVFTCIKHCDTAAKVHIIMGALLLVKTLKLICAYEEMEFIGKTGTPHGWDVAFYAFGFLKGIMLFTVIFLIGTGWTFLKPYLQEREKQLLMIVIPLQVLENVAYVIIEETGPAMKEFRMWNQMFLLIDIICCAAVFFPIIWSIRSLREASKMDGKAAKNLEKLTLFKQFYIVLVTYLYFTRVVTPVIGSVINYRYDWVVPAAVEGASLIFYIFVFCNFQPLEKNPYLAIDDNEEHVAAQKLMEDDDESFEL